MRWSALHSTFRRAAPASAVQTAADGAGPTIYSTPDTLASPDFAHVACSESRHVRRSLYQYATKTDPGRVRSPLPDAAKPPHKTARRHVRRLCACAPRARLSHATRASLTPAHGPRALLYARTLAHGAYCLACARAPTRPHLARAIGSTKRRALLRICTGTAMPVVVPSGFGV